jgi:alkylation response protein AidB-like acyl-CoA dehydrogenase
MDFHFTAEEEKLKTDVKEFVNKEWDAKGLDLWSFSGPLPYNIDDLAGQELIKEFAKKLAARGWYTMHWPKEFGGKEIPISTQLAYREEMAYNGAPISAGGGLVAPVLMMYGSDWQKEEFLPKVANADVEFAQGFSEPNAGSDLANLQTRAERDGDDYVITGQKIWTSAAHRADWYHLMARTDPDAPKHRGISYFLINLKTPGITMRPLMDLAGRRRWSEVFLDGVRVPAENLIGEENRGWYTAMTTLSFERSNIEGPAKLLRALELFIDFAKSPIWGKSKLIDDPVVRNTIADMRIRIAMSRTLSYRVAWMQSNGELPVMEASMTKLLNDMMSKYIFWPRMANLLKDYGVLTREEPRAPVEGLFGTNSILSLGSGFGGGTSEIQRNIIAQRGLGLPR